MCTVQEDAAVRKGHQECMVNSFMEMISSVWLALSGFAHIRYDIAKLISELSPEPTGRDETPWSYLGMASLVELEQKENFK